MTADLDDVLKRLLAFQSELEVISQEINNSGDATRGWERLERWKARCADWLSRSISPEEAQRLENTSGTLVIGRPLENARSEAQALFTYVETLFHEVRNDPDFYLGRRDRAVAAPGQEAREPHPGRKSVFIGHGRNPSWARVQQFIERDFGLQVVTFESETRAGQHIVQVLNEMLDQASIAVLVLTGEDVTPEGGIRARQNVIHEAGLFQGRLGFSKAILLVQSGLEEFSNVAGLQQIRFGEGEIQQTFYELGRVLKREGIVP